MTEIDPFERKMEKVMKSRTITISKGDVPISIDIINPQPASAENDNISDADYAMRILQKWDNEMMFMLRENMELAINEEIKALKAEPIKGVKGAIKPFEKEKE